MGSRKIPPTQKTTRGRFLSCAAYLCKSSTSFGQKAAKVSVVAGSSATAAPHVSAGHPSSFLTEKKTYMPNKRICPTIRSVLATQDELEGRVSGCSSFLHPPYRRMRSWSSICAAADSNRLGRRHRRGRPLPLPVILLVLVPPGSATRSPSRCSPGARIAAKGGGGERKVRKTRLADDV